MEHIKQKPVTGKKGSGSKNIESLLRDVSRKHGFVLVDFSPYQYQKAYSLYDERNIEYEIGTNKRGKRLIIKAYPVAARLLIGNYENGTFYIDKGKVSVYCADTYYKDPFGGYDRIVKLSSDLQKVIGSRFILESPDLTIEGAHELYEPLSKIVLQYFIDSESL
jgi:hypothetical protein